jgi:DDE superfamily endonuclease
MTLEPIGGGHVVLREKAISGFEQRAAATGFRQCGTGTLGQGLGQLDHTRGPPQGAEVRVGTLRDGPTRGIEEVAHICFLAQWLESDIKGEHPCPSSLQSLSNKKCVQLAGALEGAPNGVIDGTERRRQCPTDAAQQKEQYSGKQKTPTDKQLVLVNAHTTKVVYLGPTVAGKTHDKKAADQAQLGYPTNATLGKDTGFQGDEPAGVLTQQPKKTERPGVERGGQVPSSPHLQRPCGRRKRACRGETVSDCQRGLTPDYGRPL